MAQVYSNKKVHFKNDFRSIQRQGCIIFFHWAYTNKQWKNVRHGRAILIQKIVRGLHTRRRIQEQRNRVMGATAIQSLVRRRLALIQKLRAKEAQSRINSAVDVICGQRAARYLEQSFACLVKNRKLAKELYRRQERCSLSKKQLLFNHWKEMHLRSTIDKTNSAQRIQHCFRSAIVKRIYLSKKHQRDCAVTIQKHTRGYLVRARAYIIYWEYQSAVRIQKHWRGVYARRRTFFKRVNYVFDNFHLNPLSAIQKILEVDGEVTDQFGNTILHLACIHGRKDIIRLCLKHGLDINVKNRNLDTPLHSLVTSTFPDQFNLGLYLLSKGAEIDSENINGYTLNSLYKIGTCKLHAVSVTILQC